MSKVRTNIEIEDDYFQIIMDRHGLRTKTEAVNLALRHLAGQPITRKEALAMRGAQAIGNAHAAPSKRPLTERRVRGIWVRVNALSQLLITTWLHVAPPSFDSKRCVVLVETPVARAKARVGSLNPAHEALQELERTPE